MHGAEQQLAAAARRANLLGAGIGDPAGVLAQDAALQRRAGELSRELRGRVGELVDRELAAPSAELVELVDERPEHPSPRSPNATRRGNVPAARSRTAPGDWGSTAERLSPAARTGSILVGAISIAPAEARP